MFFDDEMTDMPADGGDDAATGDDMATEGGDDAATEGGDAEGGDAM